MVGGVLEGDTLLLGVGVVGVAAVGVQPAMRPASSAAARVVAAQFGVAMLLPLPFTRQMSPIARRWDNWV